MKMWKSISNRSALFIYTFITFGINSVINYYIIKFLFNLRVRFKYILNVKMIDADLVVEVDIYIFYSLNSVLNTFMIIGKLFNLMNINHRYFKIFILN